MSDQFETCRVKTGQIEVRCDIESIGVSVGGTLLSWIENLHFIFLVRDPIISHPQELP